MSQICSTCLGWMLHHKFDQFRCIGCGFTKFREKIMITRDEVLMGRDKEFPLSAELESNLTQLLDALNKLRSAYGKPMSVSSGYRPGHYNKDAGGAKNSPHVTCQAVDFHDIDGSITAFCTEEILEQFGLYREQRQSTPTWCHLQIRPTHSRVFIP